MSNNLIVCTLSGGLDSSTVAYLNRNKNCVNVFFNYGQINYEREIHAAKAVSSILNQELKELVIPKLSMLDVNNFWGVTDDTTRTQTGSFIPGRNLILFSIAGSIAVSLGASELHVGLSSSSFIGRLKALKMMVKSNSFISLFSQLFSTTSLEFPDCSPKFLRQFESLFQTANSSNLSVKAPLHSHTKKQMIELLKKTTIGQEILTQTWSCYANTAKPCGTCQPCTELNLNK